MSICILSHPSCLRHDMGASHPESPARLTAILATINAHPFNPAITQLTASQIDRQLLNLAHEPEYIDYLFANSPQSGLFQLDPDTCMNPYSLEAALFAAGAATQAVDKVMAGEFTAAFCATRPPGHHAERGKAMGFCLFNHVAIAALYAQQQYQLKRIAILDFDVHHGNGTENIMSDKRGFLFCSSFQHPLYPYSGIDQHPAHIINTPLPAGSGGEQFRDAVSQHWLPALDTFQPELILISAGFDGHRADQLAQLNLTEADYQWVTQAIRLLAEKHAKGRIVSILEGGYSLPALAQSVIVHLEALQPEATES